jgi:hypothetical protein
LDHVLALYERIGMVRLCHTTPLLSSRLLQEANPVPADLPVTIRLARPADRADVVRLAALEARPVPVHPMLVAQVGDETWAAVSIHTGESVADPFRPSGALVDLLRRRSAQLRAERAPERPRPAWRRLAAFGRA